MRNAIRHSFRMECGMIFGIAFQNGFRMALEWPQNGLRMAPECSKMASWALEICANGMRNAIRHCVRMECGMLFAIQFEWNAECYTRPAGEWNAECYSTFDPAGRRMECWMLFDVLFEWNAECNSTFGLNGMQHANIEWLNAIIFASTTKTTRQRQRQQQQNIESCCF